MLGFLTAASPDARRALVAASGGWLLNAFDVMLYAMVLSELIAAFGMSLGTAGQIGSLTLLASAAGGIVFGLVADRLGRTRALALSVTIYAAFTAACGFS
ncbi:MAG: MFS transporter [Acidimicrobiia bacterium]|nr:MFS transporter [Acidimicrobiia bacterium]